MEPSHSRPASGFHEGERAVQRLVGVQREAASLEGMLAPASISRGMAGFLAQRTFAAITARDHQGRLWTSPLVAAPGFLEVTSATSLRVHAAPGAADPLHEIRAGQPIALIALDYERRRRFRINGTLGSTGPEVLDVQVTEAFGNCPQYITPRLVEPREPGADQDWATTGSPGFELTEEDRDQIGRTTGFLFGTTHPGRGTDASHRGGAAGFLRVADDVLWWPDYPGNNLFNSLGNLQVDPEAALLVPDFERGTALHLHGTAELLLTDLDAASAPDETGRRVLFTPRLRTRTPLAVASRLLGTPGPAPERTDP